MKFWVLDRYSVLLSFAHDMTSVSICEKEKREKIPNSIKQAILQLGQTERERKKNINIK